MSGAPLTYANEHDIPDYAADPKGERIPLDAHIRLANPRTPGTEANLILRRGYNYSRGVTNAGQLDMGLLFVCFQADLAAGFLAVQNAPERRAARGIHQAGRRRLFLRSAGRPVERTISSLKVFCAPRLEPALGLITFGAIGSGRTVVGRGNQNLCAAMCLPELFCCASGVARKTHCSHRVARGNVRSSRLRMRHG